MSDILPGLLIAAVAFAATLLAVSSLCLWVAILRFQEERRGTGCHAAGCRRSRPDQGWTPRVAENTRGDFTREE